MGKILFFLAFFCATLFSFPLQGQIEGGGGDSGGGTSACNCPNTIGSQYGKASLSAYLTQNNKTLPLQIGCLTVGGRLDIDVFGALGDHFTSMDLIMQSDAEINVLPSYSLNMTGVRVYACDQLWKSITLGSNSRLDLEQCIIQDAKHAINAQKVLNVDINLQGNQFNDNYTGVFLDGVSLKNAIIGMKGNTFTLNALKSGTLPSVPEAPTGLYAASINQININEANTFKKMHFGMYFNGGRDIRVTNNNFEDNKYGIYCYSSRNVNLFYNTMTRAERGIYAWLTFAELDIEFNNIDSKFECVYSLDHHNDYSKIIVKNNPMLQSADGSCVVIKGTSQAGGIQVNDNPLIKPKYVGNLAGAFSYGIHVEDVSLSASFPVEVLNNIVDLGTGSTKRNGIFLNNVNSQHDKSIYRNTVNSRQSVIPSYGIHVRNSPGFTLQENQINNIALNRRTIYQGIRVENSKSTILRCNFPNYCTRGLDFVMNNDASKVNTTIYGNHQYGMYYENGAITGRQDHTGNDWFGAVIPAAGADGYFVGNAPQAAVSFYTIDPNQLRPNSRFIVTQGNEGDWVLKEMGSEPGCGLETSEGTEGLTTADFWAAGTLTDPDLAVVHWEAQRNLYQKLLAQPTLANGHAALSAFFSAAQMGAVGAFEAVETAIQAAYAPVPTLELAYTTAFNTMQTKSSEYGALSAASPIDTAALAAKGLEFKTSMDSVEVAVARLRDAHNPAIDQALALNAALAPATVFQQNEKNINAEHLWAMRRHFQGFDSTNQALIDGIAAQCPVLGGRGVYRARSLQYCYKGESEDYVETDECLGDGDLESRSGRSDAQALSQTGELFPNPATEVVTLRLSKPLETESTLTLWNATGQAVWQQTLPPGTQAQSFDIGTLPKGFYTYTLRNGQQSLLRNVLIVLR